MIRYQNSDEKTDWDEDFSTLVEADIKSLNRVFASYNFTSQQIEYLILEVLPSKDEVAKIHVLEWVLEHENVSTKALSFIVDTPSMRPTVAELWPFPFIAEHPNVSTETLHTMLQLGLKENSKYVVEDLIVSIATQPALSAEDVLLLLDHEDSLVRSAAVSNVNTPAEVLNRFAFEPETPVDVLSVISKHASTSTEALVHILKTTRISSPLLNKNLPFNVLLEAGKEKGNSLSRHILCLETIFETRYEDLQNYVTDTLGEEYLSFPNKWLARMLGFPAEAITRAHI